MTFNEALIEFQDGKRIRKRSWFGNPYIAISLDKKTVYLMLDEKDVHKKLNEFSEVDKIFSAEDIFADDWEVIE